MGFSPAGGWLPLGEMDGPDDEDELLQPVSVIKVRANDEAVRAPMMRLLIAVKTPRSAKPATTPQSTPCVMTPSCFPPSASHT